MITNPVLRCVVAQVAIKQISTSNLQQDCDLDDLQNEIEILLTLDHPNILKLYESAMVRLQGDTFVIPGRLHGFFVCGCYPVDCLIDKLQLVI